MTDIVTASGDTNLPGIVRLSAGGRYALVSLAATARLDNWTISFLDLQTNTQSPINLPAPAPDPPSFPEYPQITSSGRVIANDGTAVLTLDVLYLPRRGFILKPGAAPQPFPIQDGLPLIIDAAASKVLYQEQDGLYLLDLHTLASTLLIPADQAPTSLATSDDAGRLLFLSGGQAHLLDTVTLIDRILTADPAQIATGTISGDGKIVFAVTGVGRLLQIGVDDGSQIELIGHTPYLNPFSGGYVIQGFTTTLDRKSTRLNSSHLGISY